MVIKLKLRFIANKRQRLDHSCMYALQYIHACMRECVYSFKITRFTFEHEINAAYKIYE